MAKKKKNIIIKQGLDDWVMTYGDMMSLLLTFFVLIVSFSSMQETKFQQAANSLRDAFGVLATPESVIAFNDPLVPNHNPSAEESDVLYEVRHVEKLILDEGLDKQVAVEVRDDGVLFRMNAPFLFKSGGAELAKGSAGVLEVMSKFFTKFPYEVEVNGHTDDVPINSQRFPSNWDLSAARAVTVARYFQSIGMPPERIAATGYGEFHPIADNKTQAGREKNRRVEIFLHLDQDGLAKQPELPFSDSTSRATSLESEAPTQTTEKMPVRPIINPVTGKLGILPVNK